MKSHAGVTVQQKFGKDILVTVAHKVLPEIWAKKKRRAIIRSPLSGQVRSDFAQHRQDYFLRVLFQAAAQLHRPAPDKCTKWGKIKQKVLNCRYKQFGT